MKHDVIFAIATVSGGEGQILSEPQPARLPIQLL